jgi:cellobiose epimerase
MKIFILPGLLALLSSMTAAEPPAGTPHPAAAGPQPRKEDFLRARASLEKLLTENLLPFWYPATIDQEQGGFRLNHDVEGKYLGPSEKAIVTQARNVWFFARLSKTRFGRPEHLAAARHGFEFLRDKMWDRQHGGFYWSVNSDGSAPLRAEKHLYGQAFGLYALSEYAADSGDAGALKLARELFALLESKAHDADRGGYRESFDRDWTEMPASEKSPMGLASHLKLMNTHLHLMEALTTYARATKDAAARERLIELIFIQSGSVLRKDAAACSDRHLADWTPLRGPEFDRVSYGHDLENIWLLQDACQAAAIPDALLGDLYRTLFQTSLRLGFDSEKGGFFDSGPFGAPADRKQKVWWVQAEALVSALRMYRLTGDRAYYDVFARTLDWIDKSQVDWKHGDWHEEISPDGAPRGAKAGPWKSAYHNGRAILECLKMLEEMPEPR